LFLSIKIGTTEPLLAKTFPYLTTENRHPFFLLRLFADINNLSEHSLVAPYKFTGEEALSVERAITLFTSVSKAASIRLFAPPILVFINSVGLYSAAGTCFNAAA